MANKKKLNHCMNDVYEKSWVCLGVDNNQKERFTKCDENQRNIQKFTSFLVKIFPTDRLLGV